MAVHKSNNLKYKPKEKVLPPTTVPAVDDVIGINEAISLIAHQCKPNYESLRAYRNKVSNTMNYAIRSGLINVVHGQVIFGELMAWAKTKPRWQLGLTQFQTLNIAFASLVMPMPTISARAICLPTTMEKCHQALIEADLKIANLQAQLEAARGEIESNRNYVALALRMKRPKRKG